MQNHIIESTKQLTKKWTNEQMKNKYAKELLDYMPSISKSLKQVKYFTTKNTINNIKMSDKQYVKKENSYCLVCRGKKTGNKKIKGIVLLNKIASQRSLCTDSTARKSTFIKQNSGSKMLKPKMYR